jgi:hypothetical protein
MKHVAEAGLRPPAPGVPAASAPVPDHAKVLGVSVGGKHRAYPLLALSRGPENHIVNDRVGDAPITVTFCDLCDCAQVLTGDAGERGRLDVTAAGVDATGMFLEVDGRQYHQDSLQPVSPESPAFPYRRYPFERTTWGRWKAEHPDTDVFLGWGYGPFQPS